MMKLFIYNISSMSKRFKNILKYGPVEATALQNYVAYISNPQARGTKSLQGGTVNPRGSELEGLIVPFSENTATASEFIVKYSQAASQVSLLDTAIIATNRLQAYNGTPANATVPPIQAPRGFKPARASYFAPSGAQAYKQSKITKLYYIHYPGTTHSLPFGGKNGDTTVEGAMEGVKKQIQTDASGVRYHRVSVTPEVMPVA